MLARLFLLFTIVPLVELYLLLWMGSRVGFWPTLAMVLVTGMVGAAIAKREGLRVFRGWSEAVANGRVPEQGVLDGVLVLVAGTLLITPGVLTDVTGLLLMLPPVRKAVAGLIRRRMERRFVVHSFTTRPGAAPPAREQVVDAQGGTVREDRAP